MNNLGAIIARAFAKAVRIVPEASRTVTYKAFQSSAYSTATGASTATYTDVESVKSIVAMFNVREIDGQVVRVGDQKFVFKNEDLGGLKPGTQDRIVDGDGVTWQVQSVTSDPTKTIHILHARRFST